MSRLQQFIVGGVEDITFPFKTDIVSISHLKNEEHPVLAPDLRKVPERHFARALTMAAAKQIMSATKEEEPRRIYLKDGSCVKLWIIRNHDIWSRVSDEELVAEYERFMADSQPGGCGEAPLSAQRTW